jgi:hypothetical protein
MNSNAPTFHSSGFQTGCGKRKIGSVVPSATARMT